MKRAILTGFEPFGAYRFNPTQDLALEYDGKKIGDIEVTGMVLPCTYYGAFGALSVEIEHLSPDIVLSVGLASRVPRIRIEAVGRNIMGSKYADADGKKPDNELIIKGGRPSYAANADSIGLASSLHEAGIPAEISVDAEGFICNSLLYLTARDVYERGLPVSNAFFHTPWTDDYLGRIELEPGKVTIRKQDLRKAAGIMLSGMGQRLD
ncbi:Pyrrolidone-carboxylate peptidase [sediment metagenome]|uniref:Pyrrolidone-carboxylate peptidase n=1 Tax=sediment metagenome TaxID=749907 RepID=D9PKX3_9ZZZZ